MVISCLTVTKTGRLEQLKLAVHCFNRQSHAGREMVIVHDGDEAYEEQLERLLERFPGEKFRVVRTGPGKSLGELRNLSVEAAAGNLVCQWDDDDLYHPERLAQQYRCLIERNADFCFLTDQLHWFQNTSEFFWDDWNVETYPMNLIQGTLMGRRAMMPRYPALPRGEDTPLLRAIHNSGTKLADLGGYGYLYIYTYSGQNAWDFSHHAAISRWKRLRKDRLDTERDRLTRELQRYDLPVREARFPHDDGEMVIKL